MIFYFRSFLLFAFFSSLPLFASEEFSILAGVEKKVFRPGEKFTFTLMVIGKNDFWSAPKLSLKNLNQIKAPEKIVRTEILDRPRMVIRYLYKLEALSEGMAKVGEITFSQEGRVYFTSPIVLKVSSQFVQKDVGPSLFFQLKATSYSPFVREVFSLRARLGLSEGVRLLEENYFFPNVRGLQRLKNLPYITCYEVLDNRIYKIIEYQDFVLGKIAQSIDLDKFRLECKVVLPKKEKKDTFDKVFGEDDFFQDDFFTRSPLSEAFGGVEKKLMLSASPIQVKISPLPSPLPNTFSKAVGNFTMESFLTPKVVSQGEFVTQIITIKGDGDLSEVNLQSFAPVMGKVQSYQENQWIRVFELVYVAEEKGFFQPPPVTFVYFDPQEKKYKKLVRSNDRAEVR